VARIIDRLAKGESAAASGVFGSAFAVLCAAARERLGRPMLVVTRGPREAEDVAADLETVSASPVYLFPAWETLPGEGIEPHPDLLGDRFQLLAALSPAWAATAAPPIVVASAGAVSQRIVLPAAFAAEILRISRGGRLPLEDLVSRIEAGGYRRVEMVEEKGEYCVRGGIVDFFPPAADFPARVEFGADAVETIRTFHPRTQLAIEETAAAVLTPASEISLLGRSSGALGTILDHLPRETVIVLHEPAAVRRAFEEAGGAGEAFLGPNEIDAALSSRAILRVSLLGEASADAFALDFASLDPYRAMAVQPELGGKWGERIFAYLSEWAAEGMRVCVFCNTDGERRRLDELLAGRGVAVPPGGVVAVGRLREGFLSPGARLAVVTDQEIFARYRVRRPRRRFKGTAPVREFTELAAGDHVVHVGHGIGVYRGVTRLAKDGVEREYLILEYQEKAKLYVPIEQAGLVERYVGVGKAPPVLDRLGGSRWQNARVAAQRAIFDYAAEILQLQAARAARPGFAFPAGQAWEKEFEEAFIYEETPDQAAAIEEMKRDMESPHPMDRLVCGDVGYGKTEVAMRGAFKAVMAGKQVAVLVPTTVLAQQHMRTFSDRFADYPVRIEMLSRFRPGREQSKVVEGLRDGTVDIVIGTHRLVQPDVAFKDLGLVVIDEEQRFGVRHKELLKKLRLTVDVLTLTATPIPRTLYLSLSGIRDMSTIATPPEDRLSIETVVREYDARLVAEAVRRELAREGQVYFVHNRIETIGRVKELIERLVPEASVAVGHGRMGDAELEGAMRRFVEGGIDVLVCTTIIQSGLDIPNANTIVIDRADRFGLAELYQLRGRVGRYKHRAYAYLLYPPGGWIVDDARKRLKAILDHPGLGAGFKIALRDLEIRGAGNILGHEQHGHIAAIGFDLYCKLLRRSVDRLKGKEIAGVEDIEVNLPYRAELPASYVRAESQRIDLYRRLGEISSPSEIEAVAAELRDRFGPLPEEAGLLLEVCRLKLAARGRGIRSVSLHEEKIVAVRHGEDLRPGGRYPRLSAKDPAAAVREIAEKIGRL
jgi:transcription-repair coupling factor (superfamily II helicase)